MNLIKRHRSETSPAEGAHEESQPGRGIVKSQAGERFMRMEQDLKKKDHDPRRSLIKRGTVQYEAVAVFESGRLSARTPLEKTGEDDLDSPILNPEVSTNGEDLRSLEEQAQALLAEAKAERDRILSEAQAKAKKLIEQSKLYSQTAHANAEREGFAEGKERARDEAVSDLRKVMESARDTLKQTRQLHETLAKSMESGLAKLAVKIAEKVISKEVSSDPDVVVAMVRAQLEKMKDRDHVIIHVHPEDLHTVKEKKEMFVQFAPQVKTLEIESDSRVDRGSCMVETNLGTVDASITTQLQAIELVFSKLDGVEKEKEENDLGAHRDAAKD